MNTNTTITKAHNTKKDFYSTLSLFDNEEVFKSKIAECQLRDNLDRKIRFANEQKETLKDVRELGLDQVII